MYRFLYLYIYLYISPLVYPKVRCACYPALPINQGLPLMVAETNRPFPDQHTRDRNGADVMRSVHKPPFFCDIYKIHI
jgi:hypothetical protein